MDVVYKVTKLFGTMDYIIKKGRAYEEGSPEWKAIDDELTDIFSQLEDLKPYVSPDDAVNILMDLNKLVDAWNLKS